MGHLEALSRCAVASGLPLLLILRHDFSDLIVIQLIMRPSLALRLPPSDGLAQ
jgi:hypothetical protein